MAYEHEKTLLGGKEACIPLFEGIDLIYIDKVTESFSLPDMTPGPILQIHYCKAGQAVWKAQNTGSLLLNPGDFSVHLPNACADHVFCFPTGRYRGLAISVNLQKTTAHPPELIAQTKLLDGLLQKKFCQSGTICFFEKSGLSESIFAGFYDQPKTLERPYQRLKLLELLLYLAQTEPTPQSQPTEYPAEQIRIVKAIHEQFLLHMEQRITIEELSRQYLINPTTLKAVFKAVYGTSLAAHIKMHRMERAAGLLQQADLSIAQVAAAVGYESQSRFTAAFKSQFGTTPRGYRKRYGICEQDADCKK